MESQDYQKLIVAVDFDGTIAGRDENHNLVVIPGADTYIRKIRELGHTIVLYTCREGKNQWKAEKFMEDHNIPYDRINANFPGQIALYGHDSRKINADVYVDDKAVGGMPSWETVYNWVVELSHKLPYTVSNDPYFTPTNKLSTADETSITD